MYSLKKSSAFKSFVFYRSISNPGNYVLITHHEKQTMLKRRLITDLILTSVLSLHSSILLFPLLTHRIIELIHHLEDILALRFNGLGRFPQLISYLSLDRLLLHSRHLRIRFQFVGIGLQGMNISIPQFFKSNKPE